MGTFNINTEAGTLDLTESAPSELQPIAILWPMGLVFSQAETQPNGLVFQIGEEEAHGVKLQPPDTDKQTATALFFNNLALIASALPFYLERRHQGIMLPCAYFKEKTDGRFESGLAFFVSAHPTSKSPSQTEFHTRVDDQLGDGASRMIFDMTAAIPKAAKQFNLAVNTVIGIDVRPRLALETLGMPFLVHGAKVFAIQHPLRKEDPFWAYAVRAGFTKLPYAPVVTTAVPGPPNAPHAWKDRAKILSKRLSNVA
jgi:hypothetical protein